MDANFDQQGRLFAKKYTYNHVHNATLLQDIMKELAGADKVRKLKDAAAPGTDTAHSVTDRYHICQQ
jgi:hypothetical protein